MAQENRVESGVDLGAKFRVESEKPTMFSKILKQLHEREMSKQEVTHAVGLEKVSGHINKAISRLLSKHLIERTIPEIPNHPAQKFRITTQGTKFLEMLK